jgi:hypothetical protein
MARPTPAGETKGAVIVVSHIDLSAAQHDGYIDARLTATQGHAMTDTPNGGQIYASRNEDPCANLCALARCMKV